MKEETYLSTTISAIGDGNARSNVHALRLLADKQILARIIKRIVPEFAKMPIAQIMQCISEVNIQSRAVNPGLTNLGPVDLSVTVDDVQNEGMLLYDIRFVATIGENAIRILLNVEAQNTVDPRKLGYHISNRIVFYLARMISAQKNTEFFHSDYDNIKKVYSIWICMNGDIAQGAIEEIALQDVALYGTRTGLLENDLVHGIMITVPDKGECDYATDEVVQLLNALFRKESSQEKKRNLEEKYQLEMSVEIEKEMTDMCNLMEWYAEKGIKEGIEEGIKEGTQTVVRNYIINSRARGTAMEAIEADIVALLSIAPEEAHQYIMMFAE